MCTPIHRNCRIVPEQSREEATGRRRRWHQVQEGEQRTRRRRRCLDVHNAGGNGGAPVDRSHVLPPVLEEAVGFIPTGWAHHLLPNTPVTSGVPWALPTCSARDEFNA